MTTQRGIYIGRRVTTKNRLGYFWLMVGEDRARFAARVTSELWRRRS